MSKKSDEHDEHAEQDKHAASAKPDEHSKAPAASATKPMEVQGGIREEHHDPIDPRTGLRGRPDSPSDRPGQLTRDNVNPNIPSGKPGDPPGPIVDPNSLGMPQGGVAPAYQMKPETSPDQPPRPPGQDQPPPSGAPRDKGHAT